MAYSSCFAANFDTLEKGALMHGLEANTLVDELNNLWETHFPRLLLLYSKDSLPCVIPQFKRELDFFVV